jgi:hypothetical protein
MLLRMTRLFRDWTERLRKSSENLDGLKTIAKAFFSIFSILFMVVKAILKPFGLLQGITSGVAGGFLDLLVTVSEAIIKFRDMAEETDFFDRVVASIIEHTKEFVAWVKDLVQQFKDLEIVERVIATILWAFEEIKKVDPAKVWEGFLNVLRAIVAPFYLAAKGAEWLYNEIVKLGVVQDVISWFNDIDLNKIKQEFIEVGESVKEFIEGIKDSDIVKEFSEAIGSIDLKGEWEEFIQAAKDGFGWIGTGSEKAKEGISNLIPDLTFVKEAASKLGAALKDAFSHLWDYLSGDTDMDYDRLFKFINAGLAGGFILSLRELANMFSLDTIFGDTDIGEALVEDLEGLENALNGLALGLKADALKNIAIGIALLAGSIFLLSAIPSDKLAISTGAVAAMALSLAGSTRLMGSMDLRSATGNAVLMVGLAFSLGLVADALIPITEVDPARLTESMEALGKSMVGLVGSVIAITKMAGKNTDILVIVGIMYAIGKALNTLAIVVKQYGEMDPDTLKQGGEAVGIALAALTGAVIAVSKMGGAQGQKLGVSLLTISAALFVLGRAIEYIGKMDPDVVSNGLFSIGIALAGFAVFTNYVKTDGVVKTGIAIGIISGSLFLLAEAVEKWAGMDNKDIIKGLITIGVALGIMVLALRLAGPTALPASIAIGVMSLAILALAAAFTILGELDIEQVKIGMLVIAGVLGILTVAGYLMAPIVPVLIGLGLAMLLIGLGGLALGAGLFLAAIGLTAIAGSAYAIAAAIPVVGDAVIEIIPRLAGAFAEAVVSFITVLAEKTPELMEAFKTLILEMMKAITDEEFMPKIFRMVLDFVSAMVTQFQESKIINKLVQAGWDVLKGIIKGVEDNIQDIVDSGLGIIENFIKGIEEGGIPLMIQAKDTLMTFIETIEDEILTQENIRRMTEVGVSIAGNILAGVTQGLIDGARNVIDTFGDVIDDLLNEGEDRAEESSPSRRTIRLASYMIDGLVIGLKTNMFKAIRAMSEFGNVIKRNLEPVVQQMADYIEKEAIFEPVISPVLDLSKIRRSDIDKLLPSGASYQMAAAIAASGRSNGSYDRQPYSSERQAGAVIFEQNNYSPKALDRETIYRQTRTQLAKLKEERAFG